MAGIVGIECNGEPDQITRILEKIAHRGKSGSKIIESHGATLGAVWLEIEVGPAPPTLQQQAAWELGDLSWMDQTKGAPKQ